MRRELSAIVLGLMLLVIGVAAVVLVDIGVRGGEQPDPSGVIDLTRYLWIEFVAGAPASVLAGWVCRALGKRGRPVVILAATVLFLGAAECAELASHTAVNASPRVIAPCALLIAAPPLACLGVIVGGIIGSRRMRRNS